MSQPEKRQMPDVRSEMVSAGGSPLATLGDPLIKIDEQHLDATARWPSVAHMATLHMFGIQNSKDRKKTVFDLMDGWEKQYGRKSIGYQGKARDEYGKFANLAAAGGGTLASNDAALQELLSEGARTADKGKGRHFWSRGK